AVSETNRREHRSSFVSDAVSETKYPHLRARSFVSDAVSETNRREHRSSFVSDAVSETKYPHSARALFLGYFEFFSNSLRERVGALQKRERHQRRGERRRADASTKREPTDNLWRVRDVTRDAFSRSRLNCDSSASMASL